MNEIFTAKHSEYISKLELAVANRWVCCEIAASFQVCYCIFLTVFINYFKNDCCYITEG